MTSQQCAVGTQGKGMGRGQREVTTQNAVQLGLRPQGNHIPPGGSSSCPVMQVCREEETPVCLKSGGMGTGSGE